MIGWFSKRIFYPLWDLKDRSIKLKTAEELEQTQWLSEEKLKAKQWGKLTAILNEAYENSVYYKNEFDRKGINPASIKSPEDFLRVPILTKKNIQANLDRLISKKYSKSALISAKTGGSTGTALNLFFDKQCEEIRNAAAIRSDRWAGWEPGSKKAALWGNPPIAGTWKEKIKNLLYDRVIYLDTMEINEKTLSEFVNRWRQYGPSVLFGHSHSIFILAKFLDERKIGDLNPKGIISTSMMLLPSERALIERVFPCKVTNRYGCEEVGLIACECERHEGLHLNVDHLYVEIIKEDGRPAQAGEEGQIVVTDLINRGMPLIRYQVGDVGMVASRSCSCGRGLPLIEKVTGRVADFLKRKDGSLVAGVSLVERTVTAIPGIEQMQIIQPEVDRIALNVVRREGYTADSERRLLSEFIKVFGKEVEIELNYTDRIRQEPNGKYRFSICTIKNAY